MKKDSVLKKLHMPIDAVVKKHLGDLESTVSILKGLGPLKSHEDIWKAAYGLQGAIQNVLDIGSHVLAQAGKNRVETYGEVLDRLGEEGILPKTFARKIRGMAGLRNILVHAYLDLDPEKIGAHLRNLKDFEEFARHILRYLKKKK